MDEQLRLDASFVDYALVAAYFAVVLLIGVAARLSVSLLAAGLDLRITLHPVDDVFGAVADAAGDHSDQTAAGQHHHRR